MSVLDSKRCIVSGEIIISWYQQAMVSIVCPSVVRTAPSFTGPSVTATISSTLRMRSSKWYIYFILFLYIFFSYTQTHQITTSKRANEQRTVSGRNALVLDFLIAPDRCSSGKDSTAQKCVSPSKSHHSIMWNKL